MKTTFQQWKDSTGQTSYQEYKRYISLEEYQGESEFGPSMVEPSNYIPLEQLVKDYARGIVHKEREHAAFFDNVSLEDTGANVEIPEDFTDIFPHSNPPQPQPVRPEKPAQSAEPPQPEPSSVPDTEGEE